VIVRRQAVAQVVERIEVGRGLDWRVRRPSEVRSGLKDLD
jgi:hypothetical protein